MLEIRQTGRPQLDPHIQQHREFMYDQLLSITNQYAYLCICIFVYFVFVQVYLSSMTNYSLVQHMPGSFSIFLQTLLFVLELFTSIFQNCTILFAPMRATLMREEKKPVVPHSFLMPDIDIRSTVTPCDS